MSMRIYHNLRNYDAISWPSRKGSFKIIFQIFRNFADRIFEGSRINENLCTSAHTHRAFADDQTTRDGFL